MRNILLSDIKEKSDERRYLYNRNDWLSVNAIINSCLEPFDAIKVATRCIERAYPGDKYYGMTVEEVISQWHQYGNSRKSSGVSLDDYIFNRLNNLEVALDDNTPDERKAIFNQFDKLKTNIIDRKYKYSHGLEQMQYLGSELWLNSSHGIRGVLDAIFWFRENYVVFDWKNFKKLNNGYSYMLGPLSHLKDSDFNKASLQLHLYQFILEYEYELPVSGTRIGWVNQDKWEVVKPTFEYDPKLILEIINYAKNKKKS